MARFDSIDMTIALDKMLAMNPSAGAAVFMFDSYEITATRSRDDQWSLGGQIALTLSTSDDKSVNAVTRGVTPFNRLLTAFLNERQTPGDSITLVFSCFGAAEPRMLVAA